jgi:hypothetical protein
MVPLQSGHLCIVRLDSGGKIGAARSAWQDQRGKISVNGAAPAAVTVNAIRRAKIVAS